MRTDALSIFQANGSDEEKLAESYAAVVDQIQKAALSVLLKNVDLSGDPQTGSVEVRRLMSSTVNSYGTARGAGAGDSVKNNGVTVNLDQRKEIVEEINRFDLVQFGLPGVIDRRRTNFAMAMARHLDSIFFSTAESAGSSVDVSDAETVAAKIEALIQDLETTENDNVDGVDRELMALSLTPATYGALENYIDTLPNPNAGGVATELFHRVRVYSNTRQTEDAIVQVVGSIAQPVAIVDFAVADIPLSAEQALTLFFNYGTEAVMPDLIRYATVSVGESA